jgi:hypothetical protein
MNKMQLHNPLAKDPETELSKRLEHAKPITREEFLKRLEEIQKQAKDSEKA